MTALLEFFLEYFYISASLIPPWYLKSSFGHVRSTKDEGKVGEKILPSFKFLV